MTRLCVIGNSHIATVRNAWRDVARDFPAIQPEFYAQHANQLVNATLNTRSEVTVEGSQFWLFKPDSDDRQCDSIAVQPFDAVVLIGLQFAAQCVLRHYRKYHYFGLKGRRQQALTRDAFKKAAQQSVNETAALHLVGLLKGRISGPLFLVPTPLPSERGFDDAEKPGMISWRAAVANGDAEALLGMYDEICGGIEAEGTVIVRQPQDTRANFRSTLQHFADNASRTMNDEIRPDNDYVHMNDAYGALIWREIAQAMKASGLPV